MDKLNLLNRPIITGTPAIQKGTETSQQTGQAQSTVPFRALLQEKLETGSNAAFTKHAVNRVMERKIDVSEQNLARLDEGLKLAQEKGLNEALILIDNNAYIVNAAQNRVITVDGEAQKGSVFTNIDGTVIV